MSCRSTAVRVRRQFAILPLGLGIVLASSALLGCADADGAKGDVGNEAVASDGTGGSTNTGGTGGSGVAGSTTTQATDGGGTATAAGGSMGSVGTTATTGAQGTSSISGAGGVGGAGNTMGGTGGAAQGGATSTASTVSGDSGGTSGTGGTGMVEVDPDALIVAPDGTMGAPGTLGNPTTLPDALQRVSAGGTIYLRGGTYDFNSTLGLSKNGSDGSPIDLFAYPLDGERPLLDFSSMSENSSNRGLSLSGDYWHVHGIDVLGAGDNGMFVSGSHNIIEYSSFAECSDTGLQLGNGASDNLILNCDSYFNADSTLENADGFAAKLDVGTGNKFVGCRAWNNLDDGWDGYLRPADNITTTYENCWAIDNGKLKNGSVGAGDGNGFKTGGSDGKDLRHNAVYRQCIATGNVHDGFDHNSNRGSITILNSAAHDNGSNINFGTTNIAASLTIKNTISVGTNGELSATSTDITNNSWQDGRAATSADFVSLDPSELKGPRKADGSLPDVGYLHLTAGSDLGDAGVDVGLPYNGSAPDIGPFESQ